ncbi:MAG: RAMP superfamily CRISPR-associated protein [Sulfurimonas sp.]|nr:RAMP superfamily CRISPR-associated protein [Sulfurimonas sp.]
MTLKYQIKFLDYWHLSSGLSAGAKLDSSVVKDKDNIPYVPAKTIKGLAREMAELLKSDALVKNCFGVEGVDMAKCYFSNAVLDSDTKEQIVLNELVNNLYDVIASTQISSAGIAVDDSLREIEVVVPLTVNGEILDIPSKEEVLMLSKSLKLIKRMGLNRNRGLGRCEFIIGELS